MYKVIYNVKNTDKAHKLYNVLVEKTKNFDSLKEAFEYSCNIKHRSNNHFEKLVGEPVLERVVING